jgi:hypothetical protein
MRKFVMPLFMTMTLLSLSAPTQADARKHRPPVATVVTAVPGGAAAVSVTRPVPAAVTVSVAPPVIGARPMGGGVIRGRVQLLGAPAAQVNVQAPAGLDGPPVQVVDVQPVHPVYPVHPHPVAPLPMADAAPGCALMHQSELRSVIGAIQGESFSEGQLRVLGDAAQGRCFLVSHVEAILPLFSFENDKLKALEMLSAALLDRQNGFRIYALFTFEQSKADARRILSR